MLLIKKQLEESLEKLANNSAVVHYDKANNENGTINYESITFGKTTAPVALHNVANKITENSTDFVNGGQLYSLNQTLAKYFGGGARYENEEWTAPSSKLKVFKDDGTFEENSYDNIAAAFAGINSVFAKLHNEISGNIEKNALLWSNEAGAFVARHGKDEKKL